MFCTDLLPIDSIQIFDFIHTQIKHTMSEYMSKPIITGDPLHSRALAHSRAPLFTQPCPHCSHSRAPGEQWARLCVFTLQGCVQAARLCRGSPVIICLLKNIPCNKENNNKTQHTLWMCCKYMDYIYIYIICSPVSVNSSYTGFIYTYSMWNSLSIGGNLAPAVVNMILYKYHKSI